MDNRSGKIGEAHVKHLLQQQGYSILDLNYHSRFGEIDIIATNSQYIVFVEVKTRDIHCKGEPTEAVTATKQKKIVQTALLYLQEHTELQNLQPRFDVVGLITIGESKQIKEVQYITNAFDGGGLF